MKQIWARWISYLQVPVDGAALAVFRILFGTILAIDICIHLKQRWVFYSFVAPKFTFGFVPFIKPMSEPVMVGIMWGMLACAVFLALGLGYRLATVALCLGLTYFFLLDSTIFLNHTYLICLMSLLMAIVPAHAMWSLDRHLKPAGKGDFVPRWSMMILKAQLFIVYMYGAIWKLNPDWMSGLVCEQFMYTSPVAERFPVVQELWFAKFLAFGGIGVDSLVPILLVIPQTWWLGAILVVPFHLMNHFLFHIGVFPWFMLGTLALFPPTDWPRKVISFVASKFKSGQKFAASVMNAVPRIGLDRSTVGFASGSLALILFLHVYLLIQLIVPLRHLAYPGNVDWTEEGYFFSWRMMLHQKKTHMVLYQTDPATGVRKKIQLQYYLSRWQRINMSLRPQHTQLFAHWYADKVERETGVRPIITAKILATMHCRPWQDLIDPTVDLASEPIDFKPKSWILPLTGEPVDLPHWQHRYDRWMKKQLAGKQSASVL